MLVRVSDTTMPEHRLAPALGEHTDEILRELGYSAALVAELHRDWRGSLTGDLRRIHACEDAWHSRRISDTRDRTALITALSGAAPGSTAAASSTGWKAGSRTSVFAVQSAVLTEKSCFRSSAKSPSRLATYTNEVSARLGASVAPAPGSHAVNVA